MKFFLDETGHLVKVWCEVMSLSFLLSKGLSSFFFVSSIKKKSGKSCMSQALLHFTIIPREGNNIPNNLTFSSMSPHQFQFILPVAMCYLDFVFQELLGARDRGIR